MALTEEDWAEIVTKKDEEIAALKVDLAGMQKERDEARKNETFYREFADKAAVDRAHCLCDFVADGACTICLEFTRANEAEAARDAALADASQARAGIERLQEDLRLTTEAAKRENRRAYDAEAKFARALAAYEPFEDPHTKEILYRKVDARRADVNPQTTEDRPSHKEDKQ